MSLIVNRWCEFDSTIFITKQTTKYKVFQQWGQKGGNIYCITGHIIKIILLLKFRKLSFQYVTDKSRDQQVRSKEIKFKNWGKKPSNLKKIGREGTWVYLWLILANL